MADDEGADGRDSDLANDLLRIGQECAATLGSARRAVALEDLLYDERGLPK